MFQISPPHCPLRVTGNMEGQLEEALQTLATPSTALQICSDTQAQPWQALKI